MTVSNVGSLGIGLTNALIKVAVVGSTEGILMEAPVTREGILIVGLGEEGGQTINRSATTVSKVVIGHEIVLSHEKTISKLTVVDIKDNELTFDIII